MAKLVGQTAVVAIAVGVLLWLLSGFFGFSESDEAHRTDASVERPAIKNGIAEAKALAAIAPVEIWRAEFPKGDFERLTVDPAAIVEATERDVIRAIDRPVFQPVSEARDSVSKREPVISVTFNNDARAYPLRTLLWHEVVNDTVGGVPVAVTYCPFCDSAVIFDRRLGDTVLDFGVTG
ncbi:MAG: DUF3179 domain-containing protein, partial [Rhodospirillaceae bacterium]|nr:DUF3179 domain-containing protein [Rhodospirillaceae bacterium]